MLIYSMSVSVDGFIADREGAFGWSVPTEEQFRFHVTQTRELGGLLLGRSLYETMLTSRRYEEAIEKATCATMTVGSPRGRWRNRNTHWNKARSETPVTISGVSFNRASRAWRATRRNRAPKDASLDSMAFPIEPYPTISTVASATSSISAGGTNAGVDPFDCRCFRPAQSSCCCDAK